MRLALELRVPVALDPRPQFILRERGLGRLFFARSLPLPSGEGGEGEEYGSVAAEREVRERGEGERERERGREGGARERGRQGAPARGATIPGRVARTAAQRKVARRSSSAHRRRDAR